MQSSDKERAVNLGSGVGIALILVELLMIWFAPAVWSGRATFVVVIGVLSALIGFVFAFVPASRRR
ncbi:hypothetical protein [Curtobacterium sp. BRB10]|uniref:hypothetical protein n=1 Tax=Curtobacterium sp. BRB10 TaxID=2962579 RepID=UPI002881EACC|nr:hypothetical protein [Curtobacterium sp. BRB10]MDT0233996.1 hypothetical protein [Curtobacterium sp. BRB10]